MSIRNFQHQGLLDKDINIAQNYLNNTDYDIYINTGSQKKCRY